MTHTYMYMYLHCWFGPGHNEPISRQHWLVLFALWRVLVLGPQRVFPFTTTVTLAVSRRMNEFSW